MLNHYPPIAFIATDDASRSVAFYRDTLGLEMIADEPFALVFELHDGTPLRIAKVEQLQAPPYTVLGWSVDDIEKVITGLSERGIEFARYSHMPQDELGVWTTPDGTKIAWFKDPCGNTLSLTQHGN